MVDYKRMHAKLKSLIPDVELYDPDTMDYDQWFAVMEHLLNTDCKQLQTPYLGQRGAVVAWHTYMLAVMWHPGEYADKASDYLTRFHVEFFNLLPKSLSRVFSDQQRQLGDEIGEYWLYSTYKKYVLDPASQLDHVSRMKANDVLPREDLDDQLWAWAAELSIEELIRDPCMVSNPIHAYVLALYRLFNDHVPRHDKLAGHLRDAINMARGKLGKKHDYSIPEETPEELLSKKRYLELRYWMFDQEQNKLLTRLKLSPEKGLLHDGR